MNKTKRLLALLLVALMLVGTMSACKTREEPAEEPEPEVSEPEPEPEPEPGPTVSEIIPAHAADVIENQEISEDVVGWLTIDVLDISEVVVINYNDNNYYSRRDINKQDHFPGILYADRRSEFGDMTSDGLGMNTTIYGHALTDGEYFTQYEYWEKFGPLNELRKEEVARGMPYLFFSTDTEDMAFEVFAVCDINYGIPYNRNDIEREELLEMIRDEVIPRSFYNYDVDIKDDDKFMFLSTCIYTLPDMGYLGYPNPYRLIVAARLCDPDEPLKEEAEFEINEDKMDA